MTNLFLHEGLASAMMTLKDFCDGNGKCLTIVRVSRRDSDGLLLLHLDTES